MASDRDISLSWEENGEHTISGSFRLENGNLLVRHDGSGRSKRVPVGNAPPHIETLAKVILLELDDADGRGGGPSAPRTVPPDGASGRKAEPSQ